MESSYMWIYYLDPIERTMQWKLVIFFLLEKNKKDNVTVTPAYPMQTSVILLEIRKTSYFWKHKLHCMALPWAKMQTPPHLGQKLL